MGSFHDKAVTNLLAKGWEKNNPSSYTKGDFEIVFDTSNYIEVIRVSDQKRIFESHLSSDEIINHILTDVVTGN